jgi:hypothetical protein
MSRHGRIGLAALRAGIDRKTARRHLARGDAEFSTEDRVRTYRTREDPFAAVWPEIEEMLRIDPGLEAKTLFFEMQRRHPGTLDDGQLRTLQRAVKRWRASSGPHREVFFDQLHVPGEAMQTDFTWMNELEITIRGEPFHHMVCHCVLPYSNWEWARVCFSESMAALRAGFQEAVWRLGKVARFHQTDNSTAATHELKTGKRGFHGEYLALMEYYGTTPRTIAIGKSEQNGDVEASNGAMKRALDQRLRLRGSRDFDSREAYEQWLREAIVELNRSRAVRVAEELAVMAELPDAPLPAFDELEARVTYGSAIRVKGNTYTVPSRLQGERVRVRLYVERIEVFYADRIVLEMPRLLGEGQHHVDYRHVIHSLVSKPFAFRRYRYRDALFPSATFRAAYEALVKTLPERHADLEYLRLLKLSADTSEARTEAAITMTLEAGDLPRLDVIRARMKILVPETPALAAVSVDLSCYDQLLDDCADSDAALVSDKNTVAKEA